VFVRMQVLKCGSLAAVFENGNGELGAVKSPYGKPGDRLWVRETWAPDFEPYEFIYRADDGMFASRWRPSIHMPRWASRITLEVESVRVERLQDISEEDAIAEGIQANSKDGGITVKYGISDRDGWPGNDDHGWHWHEWCKTPREAYLKLWEKINGPGSVQANPWVWVVTFKRIKP